MTEKSKETSKISMERVSFIAMVVFLIVIAFFAGSYASAEEAYSSDVKKEHSVCLLTEEGTFQCASFSDDAYICSTYNKDNIATYNCETPADFAGCSISKQMQKKWTEWRHAFVEAKNERNGDKVEVLPENPEVVAEPEIESTDPEGEKIKL